MARSHEKVRMIRSVLTLILVGFFQAGVAQSVQPAWLGQVVSETNQVLTVAAKEAGVTAPVLVIRNVKNGWEVTTINPVNHSLARTVDALFRKLALYARSDGYRIDLEEQVIRITNGGEAG